MESTKDGQYPILTTKKIRVDWSYNTNTTHQRTIMLWTQ